jgi:A/G-specific adenine glycosylase
LAWYDANHRILPWRRNASSKRPVDGTEGDGAPLSLPQQQFIYYVWVSEVMSQQTQVPRAAEYFRRWMQVPASRALLPPCHRRLA